MLTVTQLPLRSIGTACLTHRSIHGQKKNNAQDYDWTEILNGQQSTSNYLESENMRNENIMQQIYLQYYNKLLEAQLVGENLNNRLTQERINQLILQNMFGY